MATDDMQRLVTGSAPAPATFKVPGNGQIRPKAIFAAFDGTNAGGAFKPALKITSDAGELVGIYPASVSVAAGASAVVSWFPRVAVAAAAAGSGIQFDVDNVGNWLEVETTGYVADSFSEPASVAYGDDAQNYGTAVNSAKGTLFTADPGLNGPGAPTIGVVVIDAGGTGTEGELGLLIQADTSSGTGGTVGERVFASGSTAPVFGVAIGASASSGDCLGLAAEAETSAGGRAIAVEGNAVVVGGTANAVGVQSRANVIGGGTGRILPFEALDHLGNPIFQVRDDGSVHVKTGASTAMVADL